MAGLRDLSARLKELQSVPSRIARRVAASINEQLADQFEQGVNAYGNAWKPLLPQTIRRKKGDARILRRTDELSTNTIAKPMAGSGIEIESLDYGEKHQTGTKHMVARKILPDGSALPRGWTDAIEEASADEFGKVMK